jgi:hypothetical protein
MRVRGSDRMEYENADQPRVRCIGATIWLQATQVCDLLS